MNKVLFIGASGMLGKPVALELLRAGFDITLMGRDTEKLQKLFPNTQTLKGDVYDSNSLESAFAGYETVYMNLSIAHSSKKNDLQAEREGVQKVIAAAKLAGVKRLGYISSLIQNYQGMNGFNWWAFEIKQAAVNAVKNSGIPYSVFYPSTFMETLDKQMRRGNRLMLLGNSEAPMWFIAARDYGIQVAWALKKAGNANQEYIVQGPEPLTFDEAARIFSENCTLKPKIMKAPIGPIKFLGILNQRMNYAANICEALNKYPEKFESEKTWNDLGKPSTKLAEYAASLKF